jgi:hypothetical protein
VRYDIVHNDYGFPDLVEDADVQSRLRVR